MNHAYRRPNLFVLLLAIASIVTFAPVAAAKQPIAPPEIENFTGKDAISRSSVFSRALSCAPALVTAFGTARTVRNPARRWIATSDSPAIPLISSDAPMCNKTSLSRVPVLLLRLGTNTAFEISVCTRLCASRISAKRSTTVSNNPISTACPVAQPCACRAAVSSARFKRYYV